MNFTIDTKPFREAVSAVSRVIQKSPVDLMSAVLVTCDKSQEIKVWGTSGFADLMVATGQLSAQPFRFAVPVDRLKALLDRIAVDAIKVKLDDKELAVSAGAVRGKLRLLDESDKFPAFNEPSGELLFDTEFNFHDVIPQVMWAAAPGGHNKLIMQGITIHAMGKDTVRVMCMQHAGACMVTLMDAEVDDLVAEGQAFVTLPQVTASMVSGVFGEAGIRAYAGRAVIEAGAYRMSVPLLMAGKGEPIKMPEATGRRLVAISRERLLDAVKAAGSMAASEKLAPVMVAEGVNDSGPVFVLSGKGVHGETETEVPFEMNEPTTDSNRVDDSFSSMMLTRALSACRDEIITLVAPAKGVRSAYAIESGPWRSLFMPVKL